MRNIRQFITGLKNYLTRSGEGNLWSLVDQERKKVCHVFNTYFCRGAAVAKRYSGVKIHENQKIPGSLSVMGNI
jgi:hypothetical protein